MKKHWTKLAIALGPVIIIASVVWEFARTNPEYNFLIEPWAIRGYDTEFGVPYIVLGVLLLVGGIATSWEGTLRDSVSATVAVYFIVAMTGYAFAFGNEELTISVTATMNLVMSMVLGAALALALRSLLGERMRVFKRALPLFVVFFLLFFVMFAVLAVGTEITVRPWAFVFVMTLLAGGLAVSIRPINMAANRMLIAGSVAGWLVILLSGGAIRQNLVDEQVATEQASGAIGVSAPYKDTQAALGWWLAGLGVTILFVGAVGLWAKRRDIVAALARARKQREAAEVSAREIEEAAAAYALEQQAAGTGGTNG